MFQPNGTKKQAGIPIIIPDKIVFKLKLIRKDKEVYLVLIKVTINQEDITIINIYAPNSSVLNFIKRVLLDFKTQIKTQLSKSR